MIPERIRQFLDRRGVVFQVAQHPPEATAQRTAASAHISGKRLAKTVLLKRDGRFVMAVLPAHESVDLRRYESAIGGPLELAREEELTALFPDCEPGAVPPLGALYGIPVVAHACLARQRRIAVNGGTHSDLIELSWDDFLTASRARVIDHMGHLLS